VTDYIPKTHGTILETRDSKETSPQGLKERSSSPPWRFLGEILQGIAGRSGVTLRGIDATSEPYAATSAKGKDKPLVQN
jgi:hypothetical protein